MGKYEVEYAQFTKAEIEAESFKEARDIAATLDGEEIAKKDPHEYIILSRLLQNFRQIIA